MQKTFATGTSGPIGQSFAVVEKQWRCLECNTDNFPRRDKCYKCKSRRTDEDSSSSSSTAVTSFGNSSWKEAFDASTRQIYYYNQQTMETSWSRPVEMGPAPNATGTFGRGAAGSTSQIELEEKNTRWLLRPARKQAELDISRLQAHEGGNDFNIWYGKFAGDYTKGKGGGLGKDPAPYRCDPENDAGWTKGSKRSSSEKAYFCLHFAKGSCAKGHECTFLHHIPTAIDDGKHEQMKDVFGRDRFQTHRDDMTGVGSFSSDCRTLYVGGIKKKDDVEALLQRHFGMWGEVEQLNIISRLSVAFVRYRCRINAEIALIAMANQSLGGGEVLNVRWAHDDPNPVAVSSKARADADVVAAAISSKSIHPPSAVTDNKSSNNQGNDDFQQIVDVAGMTTTEGESHRGGSSGSSSLQLLTEYEDNEEINAASNTHKPATITSSSSSSSAFTGSDATAFLFAQNVLQVEAPPPPPLDRNSTQYSTWYYEKYLPWITSEANKAPTSTSSSLADEDEEEEERHSHSTGGTHYEDSHLNSSIIPPIVGQEDSRTLKRDSLIDKQGVVEEEESVEGGLVGPSTKKQRIL